MIWFRCCAKTRNTSLEGNELEGNELEGNELEGNEKRSSFSTIGWPSRDRLSSRG